MKNKTLPRNIKGYILKTYSRYYMHITDRRNIKQRYMDGRRRRIINYKTKIIIIRFKNRTLPQ